MQETREDVVMPLMDLAVGSLMARDNLQHEPYTR